MKYLVAIPCLFGAAHTKEAIDSVVNQNGVSVLIIDNGSPADTKEVLNSYQDRDNVHYITHPVNTYVNPAWNDAMLFFKIADSYDYLCIMNSDLIMNKKAFEVMRYNHNFSPDEIYIPVIGDDKVNGTKEVDAASNKNEVHSGTPGVFIVLNKEQVNIVYPIPSEIKVWFGDNWIYDTLRQLGYHTIILDNLLSYHYWSQNVQRVEGISEIIEEDKKQWREVVEPKMQELIKKYK